MSVRSYIVAALIGAAAMTAPAGAATIDGPTEASALTTTAGGVRFRALATSPSQEEVYLGRSDLGVGANRVAQNVTWNQNGTNRFSFGYDAGTDTLTTSVNGGQTLSFANFISSLSPSVSATPFDVLQIQIRDDAVGAGTIALSNLTLNGTSLTPAAVAGIDGALRYWQIAGDFKQSFQITGNIDLAGSFGAAAESNRVEFIIGNAVPEPATWAMMIGGFGLVGAALRRRSTAETVLA